MPEPIKSNERNLGPEHARHQDKAVRETPVQDEGAETTAAGLAEKAKQAAAQAAETLKQKTEGMRSRASEFYDEAASRAEDIYDEVQDRARGGYEQASGWASDRYERGSRYAAEASRRSLDGMREGGTAVQRFATENPILVGVVGLAAGLLIGALLPRTRREDRAFGRYADDVREQGLRYAREAAQRGREAVEEKFGEGDRRFAQHEDEFRGPRRRRDPERPGAAGRFQNH